MKIQKNVLFTLALLLIVALICGIGFNKQFISTLTRPDNKQIVILDAGHGGLTNTID